ncbi:L-xylulose/3-keto-L-gulonate kinase [Vibrio nigripulchritudo SFn27]|uniref:L-xylulose/3-keto-L-gulonate kinase n=1 Tax=Vibrio nigripulchritudo TaxID=28173 RepID=U4K5S1_9VIBR|nr:FGGY-family carbohydrate kinase [Vibrio nigripulchritudo]CCN83460.1 L-xylulose/3-keto-L-gulonate kinase [Vibrio nigripulchritudo BLFn1]CCN88819.1 L-xylulose/3-keto-L-gulonate kinase [Vibrio nigripulchritudo SFn27]CCN94954.1 L-xylulose/3-keto-L-gulonate kinase [Vibrio nigripulchritudo ENn2]CCO41164.1 L-xylulose/3-keto-L-gulonate kinase [Vibrio nigripulchritudo SFn135]CCO52481.1 L-xylulose/3-keto-L-gulonate kinase [Vibrio nigripulchritudo Wn13]
MSYWLGIDCGGTYLKAGLYDKSGKEIGVARESLELISEHSGWVERSTTQLWDSTCSVIKKVIAKTGVDADQIQSVGISAQGKGLFLLDKNDEPMERAILSADQRSIDIVKRWQKEGIPQSIHPKTRQTLWTGHPVSIARWIKENRPEQYEQIGTVFMSHDYLRWCLTGEKHCEITNISESNLYNFDTQDYDHSLADTLGIPEMMEALPPIIGATDIAGKISSSASRLTGLRAGTPVVGGVFDVVATAICSGVRDDSALTLTMGTWSVTTGVTDHLFDIRNPEAKPHVFGHYAQKGQYITHDASPTSAGNLEWFTDLFGDENFEVINRSVGELPKLSSELLFAPFLYGSNAGLGVKSGLYGMQSLHTKPQVFQAIYEGVVFSHLFHLDHVRLLYPNLTHLIVCGGPARSKEWMQILADASGLPVLLPQIEETGCFGAAIVAMVGSQAYASTDEAMSVMDVKVNKVSPDSDVYDQYQAKKNKYQVYVESLAKLEEGLQHPITGKSESGGLS